VMCACGAPSKQFETRDTSGKRIYRWGYRLADLDDAAPPGLPGDPDPCDALVALLEQEIARFESVPATCRDRARTGRVPARTRELTTA
jgi:hypothetical protein